MHPPYSQGHEAVSVHTVTMNSFSGFLVPRCRHDQPRVRQKLTSIGIHVASFPLILRDARALQNKGRSLARSIPSQLTQGPGLATADVWDR